MIQLPGEDFNFTSRKRWCLGQCYAGEKNTCHIIFWFIQLSIFSLFLPLYFSLVHLDLLSCLVKHGRSVRMNNIKCFIYAHRLAIRKQSTRNMGPAYAGQILFSRECIEIRKMDLGMYWSEGNHIIAFRWNAQFTLGNPSISAWLSCIILQGSLCGKVWCTLVFVQLLVWKWNTLYSFTREQNSSLEAKWDNGSFCCGQAHLATSASDKCHKLIWH